MEPVIEPGYDFPAGLPGFEDERRFRLRRQAEFLPFVFLESVRTTSLRFICMPPELLSRGATFGLSSEEMTVLGEGELEWLVVVAFPDEGSPVANLLAPIALNAATARGVQAIQAGSGYSPAVPLHQEPASCS